MIETRQIEIVGTRGERGATRCPMCSAEIRMVTTPEAAEVAGVTARNVHSLVKRGRFHFARHWPARVFKLLRSHQKDGEKYFTERPPF